MCISPPPHATGAPEPPQHHPPALPRPCRGLTAGSKIRTGGGEGWSGIREMHIIHPPAPQKMPEKINTVPGHIDLSWQPLSQEPGSFHRGIQWHCQGVGVANNQQKECAAIVQMAVASCRSPQDRGESCGIQRSGRWEPCSPNGAIWVHLHEDFQ